MLSKVKLMSALEEIRLRKENHDTVVLFSTFCWLRSYVNTNRLQIADREILVEITERYAQAVLTSISQRISSSKAMESIFASPYANFPTTVFDDDMIGEEVGIFLAEQSWSRKNFREAEAYLINSSEVERDSENIRNAFFKVCFILILRDL